MSPGSNLIGRRSVESTVTIPFNRTFPPINVTKDGTALPVSNTTRCLPIDIEFVAVWTQPFVRISFQSDVPSDIQQYCGCGWPDHMLLPKGTEEGFPCRLFVMISDYTQDTVRSFMFQCSRSVVTGLHSSEMHLWKLPASKSVVIAGTREYWRHLFRIGCVLWFTWSSISRCSSHGFSVRPRVW